MIDTLFFRGGNTPRCINIQLYYHIIFEDGILLESLYLRGMICNGSWLLWCTLFSIHGFYSSLHSLTIFRIDEKKKLLEVYLTTYIKALIRLIKSKLLV